MKVCTCYTHIFLKLANLVTSLHLLFSPSYSSHYTAFQYLIYLYDQYFKQLFAWFSSSRHIIYHWTDLVFIIVLKIIVRHFYISCFTIFCQTSPLSPFSSFLLHLFQKLVFLHFYYRDDSYKAFIFFLFSHTCKLYSYKIFFFIFYLTHHSLLKLYIHSNNHLGDNSSTLFVFVDSQLFIHFHCYVLFYHCLAFFSPNFTTCSMYLVHHIFITETIRTKDSSPYLSSLFFPAWKFLSNRIFFFIHQPNT